MSSRGRVGYGFAAAGLIAAITGFTDPGMILLACAVLVLGGLS